MDDAGERPDDLTAREREVLGLVRLGLTNEEIAQRLGITRDGAKYHVSQILSKLGVSSREEASGVELGGRRRSWAALPLAAKLAAAAVVIGATAGLGVLAWGVSQNGTGTEAGDSDAAHRLLLLSEPGEVPLLNDEAATSAGFTVTHTPGDLIRNVDSATRAILVTNATVGQLDPAWLRAQYEAGVVIAAVNVTSGDLRAMVGDTTRQRGPNTDIDVPYVSMAQTVTCSNGERETGSGSFGLASPPRSHPENAIPILMWNLESGISAVGRGC
jgi:DNA-binding CsgD family transcriptional regulator